MSDYPRPNRGREALMGDGRARPLVKSCRELINCAQRDRDQAECKQARTIIADYQRIVEAKDSAEISIAESERITAALMDSCHALLSCIEPDRDWHEAKRARAAIRAVETNSAIPTVRFEAAKLVCDVLDKSASSAGLAAALAFTELADAGYPASDPAWMTFKATWFPEKSLDSPLTRQLEEPRYD